MTGRRSRGTWEVYHRLYYVEFMQWAVVVKSYMVGG